MYVLREDKLHDSEKRLLIQSNDPPFQHIDPKIQKQTFISHSLQTNEIY